MPLHATIEPEEIGGSARRAARLRMRIEAQGLLAAGEGAPVLIHNLSATGMLVETKTELSIGQKMMVSLPEAPHMAATIVWRSEALAGCLFDHPLSRAALSAAQLRNPLPAGFDPAAPIDGARQLSERLHRLRQERGLSRAALSTRTGLSRPSIWAWETGKTTPRHSSIVALARVFGVSEQEIVADDLGVFASGNSDTQDTTKELQSLIDGSKQRIAELAGVTTANVKIFIEL